MGPKWGPGKHNFVEGLVHHQASWDLLRGEWFLWYPGTLWVWPFPPNPSQGRVLQGFPPNPKIPGGPLGPLVGCLLSLCGPLAYCRGRWHGRRPFVYLRNCAVHPGLRWRLAAGSIQARRSQAALVWLWRRQRKVHVRGQQTATSYSPVYTHKQLLQSSGEPKQGKWRHAPTTRQ